MEVSSREEAIFEDALAEVLRMEDREREYLSTDDPSALWTSVAGGRGRGRGRLVHAKQPAPRLSSRATRRMSPTPEQSELLA